MVSLFNIARRAPVYRRQVLVARLFLGLFAALLPTICPAQSCNGVLGDAIINQTFGTGKSSALLPGQTTYQYVEHCPDDSQYAIVHGSTCYTNSWHELPEDHTPGDVNGNMLLVNASFNRGEFYSQSVTDLCQGMTYELSVWVLNIMSLAKKNDCPYFTPEQLDPNITMRVETEDGKLIQAINTGSIARTNAPTWMPYALLFVVPANLNNVVVKLINNGPGGCGNDLALDDIQFRPCRPLLQISFPEYTEMDITVCEKSFISLASTVYSGYTNPVFQWQESSDGIVWTDLRQATGETYRLKVDFVGKKQFRLFSTEGSNMASIQDLRCSTVSNIVSLQTKPCRAPWFAIPAAFSPNNDGLNDSLEVYHYDIRSGQLKIFNRWGEPIFSTESLDKKWDGTYLGQPCESGLYAWILQYQVVNSEDQATAMGQVLLVR